MRPSPIGNVFSMDEAAAALGISRRTLQVVIHKYPYYSTNGGRKLFSDDDIKDIWKALRCRSPSSNAPTASTISEAHFMESPSTVLRELVKKQRPNASLRKLKRS